MRRVDPRSSKFRLVIRRSPIHGRGVFAAEPIPARQNVIEYSGERITFKTAVERFRRHWIPGKRLPTYFFSLSKNRVIDGSVGGSGAEIINHSCEPNLRSRRIRGRIYYFSRSAIRPGEELLVDYRFHKNAEKIPCRCGSPKCRKTINRK
jgi:uncharacterized protein